MKPVVTGQGAILLTGSLRSQPGSYKIHIAYYRCHLSHRRRKRRDYPLVSNTLCCYAVTFSSSHMQETWHYGYRIEVESQQDLMGISAVYYAVQLLYLVTHNIMKTTGQWGDY